MAAVPLQSVVERLNCLAVAEFSDAQLVERFIDNADEAAFTALVHRHGRMVLSISRRVLGDGPDHEDVFQATFVFLARKIKSIRKRASLASWLHGVAHHLATKVNSQRTRRRHRESAADGALDNIEVKQSMRVDPAVRASLNELGNILDEELQRLPPNCRDSGDVRVVPIFQECVRSIAVSPDGRYLASAGDGGNVRLFDLDRHVLLDTLTTDVGDTRCVAFSPDSKMVAAGINDDVKLFDVSSGKPIRTLRGHKETVCCLSFSPNGEYLASGGFDRRLRVWDTREFKERNAIGDNDTISSVAFTPDGLTLANGAWDNSVRLWHVATLQQIGVLEGHRGRVNAVSFSPDGNTLATGGETTSGYGEVLLWKTKK